MLRVKCARTEYDATPRRKASSKYEDLESKALDLESKLARTSAQLVTACGNHQAPNSIVAAARACNQGEHDQAHSPALLEPRGISAQARARRHGDIDNSYCEDCDAKLHDDGFGYCENCGCYNRVVLC